MIVCETQRLRLRHITPEDAPFIFELFNEPDFVRNIGDRDIRTVADARRYILDGTVTGYAEVGFGLYLAELKEDGTPVGVCGLLKRDYLEDVDIGVALSTRFHRQGYGFESVSAVLRYAREVLGIPRIVAITAPFNQESIALLDRLGLQFERMLRAPDHDRDTCLFATGPASRSADSQHVQDEEQACAEQRGTQQNAHG
jgi:[ribosomal protein S5]-alanine N-acetyltransferase